MLFTPLGAESLRLSDDALSLVAAGSTGLRRDMGHPSEIPVPATPAVMAEEIGASAVRNNLENIVPAMRTGQLASQEMGLRTHGASPPAQSCLPRSSGPTDVPSACFEGRPVFALLQKPLKANGNSFREPWRLLIEAPRG